MALSLDLKPVMTRQVDTTPVSLDVDLSLATTSDVSTQPIAIQPDFSELILPPAALFSQDVSMGQFIASQVSVVTTLDTDVTQLRSIALEYLSNQPTVTDVTANDRIAEARSIIEEMERKNAQRDVELQWQQILGLSSELPESLAVTPLPRDPSGVESEYESQLNNMLAA